MMAYASRAATTVDELERLGALAGGTAVAIDRAPWGFSNRTWIITLAGGERRVVTEYPDPRAGRQAIRMLVALGPRLRGAGIPVPALLRIAPDARPPFTVSAFVGGTPGPELLGRAGGAALVGRLLGRVAARLRAIDPAGLPLPGAWSRPGRLATLATGWLDEVSHDLPGADRAAAATAIERLPGLLDRRAPVIAHGDLAPANLLVRDGRTAALVDFEHARLADPAFDPAWFRWMIETHHPDLVPAAWAAFAPASDVADDPVTRALLEALPVVRVLEALHHLRAEPERRTWLDRLRATLGRLQAG